MACFKINFNNDIFRIRAACPDLITRLAQRLHVSSEQIQLWADGEAVKTEQLPDLIAAHEPGKPLKLSMSLNEAKSGSVTVNDPADSKPNVKPADAKVKCMLIKRQPQSFSGTLTSASPAEGSPTVTVLRGKMVLLPNSHVCFKPENASGSLRVKKGNVLDSNGGFGRWAQWTKVPCERENGTFRLMSKSPATQGKSFLGASADAEMGVGIVSGESAVSEWTFHPDEPTEAPTACTKLEIKAEQKRKKQAEKAAKKALQAKATISNPREVYSALQQLVARIADGTKMPIVLHDAPVDESELVDMMNSLHNLLPDGFKKHALKKYGLREFPIPDQPEPNEEWDMILEDLAEMGFESKEKNVEALRAAGGDLKQAVKQLVSSERSQ